MADDPKVYLIDPATGNAYRNPDGSKQKLADYENDVDEEIYYKELGKDVDADIERLGLSEFLPENEGKK